jgi:hypothetical protein
VLDNGGGGVLSRLIGGLPGLEKSNISIVERFGECADILV